MLISIFRQRGIILVCEKVCGVRFNGFYMSVINVIPEVGIIGLSIKNKDRNVKAILLLVALLISWSRSKCKKCQIKIFWKLFKLNVAYATRKSFKITHKMQI